MAFLSVFFLPFFFLKKKKKRRERRRRKEREEEKERIKKIAPWAIKEKCRDTQYFEANSFFLIGAKIFILTPYK